MDKIEKLTPEQEAKVVEVREHWLKVGRSTEPLNRVETEKALTFAYTQINQKVPPFFWCDSIKDMVYKAADYYGEGQSAEEIKKLREKLWGMHSAVSLWWPGWYAYASFPALYLGRPLAPHKMELLAKVFHLMENTHFYLQLEDACFISERPTILQVDERHRLHADKGPAIQYKDGFGFYQIHGILVTEQIVDHPETLTIEQIDNESNVEIRRIMIERLGKENFFAKSGMVKIHEDDFGVLYERKVKDDEPVKFVKVVNATAEADGTYKDYLLRVNPSVKTAREAVASTFQMLPEQYELAAQS